ncbi:hypothetical protein ACQCT6_10670 [Cytobacillus gottheilii]|uniref:hypothetical protein n=1 Tax=Cytobacillus gottheilii TaxID=859144 RepID=UPI003CF55F2D
MIYEVRLIKGLLHPYDFFYQLQKAEEVRNLTNRIVFLFIASILIFTIGAYFGIGNDIISNELTSVSAGEFEAKKLFFALGQILWGVCYPALLLFIPALYFWSLTDIPYKKVLTLQLFAVSILVAEKAIFLFLAFQLGLDKDSSPLSLGIIAQSLTDNLFVTSFFGQISLIGIFVIWLQYKGLVYLSERKPRVLFLMVLSIHLLYWLISALLSYIKFEKLL